SRSLEMHHSHLTFIYYTTCQDFTRCFQGNLDEAEKIRYHSLDEILAPYKESCSSCSSSVKRASPSPVRRYERRRLYTGQEKSLNTSSDGRSMPYSHLKRLSTSVPQDSLTASLCAALVRKSIASPGLKPSSC